MSPPEKPGIPATVATTAIVSDAPDGSHIGHFAIVAAVEDDVPDDGVWMGGRMTGTMDGKTWE